jgi:hypothetical protein
MLLDEGARFTLDCDLLPCEAVEMPLHIPMPVTRLLARCRPRNLRSHTGLLEVDRSAMSPSPAMDFDYGDDGGHPRADSDSDREDHFEETAVMGNQAEGTAFFPVTPHTPFTPQTPGSAMASEMADPWRQLDPHEVKATSAKPFRRGKTYR